jgi:hypothetical protein
MTSDTEWIEIRACKPDDPIGRLILRLQGTLQESAEQELRRLTGDSANEDGMQHPYGYGLSGS